MVGALSLFLIGVLFAAPHVRLGVNPYDEGLMANGADLVLRGKLPAVDFYAPYPPGAFVTLALVFRCCGERLIVERWFSALLAAVVGPMGFWLVSGFTPGTERGFRRELTTAWLTGFAVSLLMEAAWMTPVRSGALVLVLATGLGLLGAVRANHPPAAFGCGILAGVTALWRLDFGLYSLAASLAVWTLRPPKAPHGAFSWRVRLPGVLAMGAGALLVLVPAMCWIGGRGGRRSAESLFWWPLTSTAAARLPWIGHWYDFLFPAAALGLSATAIPCLRAEPERGRVALWLFLVSCGFLNYGLGLTNSGHLLPLKLVSLLLASVAYAAHAPRTGSGKKRSAARSKLRLASACFMALLIATAIGPLEKYSQGNRLAAEPSMFLPGYRGDGISVPSRCADGYAFLLRYLDREVPAGVRVYSGAGRHDVFLKNDNLVYFLSGREAGTYYWCVDAGVTSTRPVQAEMVRELETNHVGVVLVPTASGQRERNAGGRSSGVHLLDDYLHRHFRPAAACEGYRIYRRVSG